MYSESGDSVTSTLTSPEGRFSISSPEPGSFVLLGSAFGYRETRAGVFELGEGGEMTVDFRLRPEPLAVEGLPVGVEGRVFDHQLVRNGFVRRLQRGLGHFLTPYEIENSLARDTESLFEPIPGVTVRQRYSGGDVLMRSGTGHLCAPAVYVDGMKLQYAPLGRDRDEIEPGSAGADRARALSYSISSMIPLHSIEAVEVYRRSAEIPVEYGVTQSPTASGAVQGTCGVLVFWTKQGARTSSSRPTPRPVGSSPYPCRGWRCCRWSGTVRSATRSGGA